VSHARDFLDAIVTKIIHLQGKKLTYWTGNFSQFDKNKKEQDKINLHEIDKCEKELKKLQEFVDKNAASNPASASSKKKVMAKLEDNLTAIRELVVQENDTIFQFPVPETKVPTPCMQL